MAISANSSLHLSSSFCRDVFPTSLSSICPLYGGSISRKGSVVFARRLFGLEEAMRIQREKELQDKKPVKRSPLRRGKVSPRLPVPDHIQKPPYVGSNKLPELSNEYQIHDSEGISHMRAAGELAARVLDYAGTLVRPSVTTDEIDKAVHQMIIDAGAYPSPLGYGGFPKSVCTSVNECMCHGIPDSRQLQDGDIINIDVTVYLNGYHGDTSKTYLCGNVNDAMKRLVKVTQECLEKGIAVCKDGASFRKIGKVISEHAEKHNYGVVDRFVGHGVGTVFHSEPIIYHHRNNHRGEMVEGQTFTIEPILTMGSIDCITWGDNWTAVTDDGRPAAQFEHSILITKTGAEILTKC
ncbi:methionine aminopeptidase 1B, chloroplastic-like [Chenopodium quinoa]|uniref:methionine aminopeptidase 1B, chloroplastic-like n=1 Tax=Chenopodium quinoa TaxID=63459 RepID=UPI000B7929B6|nr:methionine aminopeptidase 1B, chloroplastic-like [Chenopodium quinoa]